MAELQIVKEFKDHFGSDLKELQIVQVPEGINILGEESLYNNGLVLSVTVDKIITVAGALRTDDQVKIYNLANQEEVVFFTGVDVETLQPWAKYQATLINLISHRCETFQGMNLIMGSSHAIRAEHHSKAALGIGTGYITQLLQGMELSAIEMISLCQEAETHLTGVKTGVDAYYISALGRAGQILSIDSRNLEESRAVSFPSPEVKVVITNSKIPNNPNYQHRGKEIEEITTLFSQLTGKEKQTFRDITNEEFTTYSHQLPEPLGQRAEHVINENQRVLDGFVALEKGDSSGFGYLMYQSHQSLKNLYEVSSPELDYLVSLARTIEGVYGSRMAVGSFDGCTVSLVRAEAIESFIYLLGSKYRSKYGVDPEFSICNLVDGSFFR